MKTIEQSNVIRRDIFSVKVWNGTVNSWCHEVMTTDRDLAKQLKTDKLAEARRSGRSGLVAIVHPRQWVVDGYLAYGNTIN